MGNVQLELRFGGAGRGGARAGAGRKRLPAHLRSTPHRARPVHRAAHPVHVTLRAAVHSLRRQLVARVVLRALGESNSARLGIVHFSVQENHLHLIVEAADRVRLSSGVRGLMVRIARRVNPLLARRGRFWADRWHGHALKSPREVRNALVYVLQNRRKHAAARKPGEAPREVELDALSSAPWFEGFSPLPRPRSAGPPDLRALNVTVPATTWLLRTGWKKRGRINPMESPKSESVRKHTAHSTPL